MSITLRASLDQDLEPIAAISSEGSGSKVTAAAIPRTLQTLEARCRSAGVAAELKEQLVGFGRA